MAEINLRKYYPDYYARDFIIDVPDELVAQFIHWEHGENAFQRKRYRHRSHLSLDRGDSVENDILFVSLTPSELYERKVTYEQLHAAITKLPEKQGKRVYAHYFMGMSMSAIARAEGVSRRAIRDSMARALRTMEVLMKETL